MSILYHISSVAIIATDGQTKAREGRVRAARERHVARAPAPAGGPARARAPAALAATHRAADTLAAIRAAEPQAGQGERCSAAVVID